MTLTSAASAAGVPHFAFFYASVMKADLGAERGEGPD
jgi:hypothetical protein